MYCYWKMFSPWKTLTSALSPGSQLIIKGAHAAEDCRSLHAEQKHAACKARATSPNSSVPSYFCPTSGRGFLAWIGLISHLQNTLQVSQLDANVFFGYEGRTVPNKTARPSKINIMQTWRKFKSFFLQMFRHMLAWCHANHLHNR